ncbi:hypothetical protein PR202_gb09166 [Eleusine coracana subsp. coracana]|uniref:Uncharacterized protein n=1 Tax=Eleusine coracana subsp. coracana TaxID=191504 RepID=A0AAV5EGP3_ELECO|nr:hypothetical protein PR202_gb09166 [Eleusine coracana subsp. coracana]
MKTWGLVFAPEPGSADARVSALVTSMPNPHRSNSAVRTAVEALRTQPAVAAFPIHGTKIELCLRQLHPPPSLPNSRISKEANQVRLSLTLCRRPWKRGAGF